MLMGKQKAKNKQSTKVIIASLIFGCLVFAVGLIFFVQAQAHSRVEAAGRSAETSPFSFNTSGAEGWWQGAVDARSIVLFNERDAKGCFVSLVYKEGVVDRDRELSKRKSETESSGQYSFVSAGSKQLSLRTSSGQKPYELHLSSIIVPAGADDVKRGQAFGYVQLIDGYVEAMGVCDTPEQIESIYPALTALSVDL